MASPEKKVQRYGTKTKKHGICIVARVVADRQSPTVWGCGGFLQLRQFPKMGLSPRKRPVSHKWIFSGWLQRIVIASVMCPDDKKTKTDFNPKYNKLIFCPNYGKRV